MVQACIWAATWAALFMATLPVAYPAQAPNAGLDDYAGVDDHTGQEDIAGLDDFQCLGYSIGAELAAAFQVDNGFNAGLFTIDGYDSEYMITLDI